MFCTKCGAPLKPNVFFCLNCGVKAGNSNFGNNDNDNKWTMTLVLCWTLGFLGVHSFYLGKTGTGIAQLLLGICSCFLVSAIWAFIDGIRLLMGTYKDVDGNPLCSSQLH